MLERSDRCPGTDTRSARTNEHGDILPAECLGPHLSLRFVRRGCEPDDARSLSSVSQRFGLVTNQRFSAFWTRLDPILKSPVIRRAIPGHWISSLAQSNVWWQRLPGILIVAFPSNAFRNRIPGTVASTWVDSGPRNISIRSCEHAVIVRPVRIDITGWTECYSTPLWSV